MSYTFYIPMNSWPKMSPLIMEARGKLPVHKCKSDPQMAVEVTRRMTSCGWARAGRSMSMTRMSRVPFLKKELEGVGMDVLGVGSSDATFPLRLYIHHHQQQQTYHVTAFMDSPLTRGPWMGTATFSSLLASDVAMIRV